MRRTRRPLGPEEAALWSEIASTVRPLARKIAVSELASDGARPASAKLPDQAIPDVKLAPFEISARARPEPKVGMSAPKEPSLRMDARAFIRMRRGKLVPEARIDLHGMTVAEAHSALTSFILRAHGAGLRLVLVITGKGKAGAVSTAATTARGGVLRHQVPHWLQMSPLGSRVLQVAEAHISHGGAGALYVYLRRAG